MAPTIRPMNIWSSQGLDLSDSTFVKLYDSAIKFTEKDDNGEPIKKFKLSQPERFNELRNILTTKVNRLAMKTLLQVTQNSEDFNLLDQAQLVTEATMIGARDSIWAAGQDPKSTDTQEDVDKISDQRIKSNALGVWLENALSSDALAKLEHHRPKYTVEKSGELFISGQFLWWLVVDEVKPNNDTLVQHAKDRLNKLDVTKFDYSVREMLTEFDNISFEIESKLKGNLSEDEKMSALWKCLATMKEDKFASIVFEEKRKYRNSTAAVKTTSDEFIRLFKREQVNMEADNIWNKKSGKDQQIIALTSMLKNFVEYANNATSTSSSGQSDNSSDKKHEKRRRETPAWKFERNGSETECERDGKTWYWCPHHKNPNEGVEGMWGRHKAEDHKHGFRGNGNGNGNNGSTDSKSDDTTKPKDYKAAVQQPSVKVDSKMFNALKSGADIQVFLNQIAAENNSTTLN